MHRHRREDNAYSVKMYRQSRILVLYQFECAEVEGNQYCVRVKACQWSHPTLLSVAREYPPYYSTDYPWSTFLGLAVGAEESEDPLLCASQPARFLEWFRQRWGNLHATAWRRSDYDQIVIQDVKLVATCIEHEFFMKTYPT